MNEGHLVTVMQGASATQIATLVFCGVLACSALVWLVNWIISVRNGNMPKELSKISERLNQMTIEIVEIKGKLWSTERIKAEIQTSIQQHELLCPCRNNKENKK